MKTFAPTPIQVDVMVLDAFIFAMEEREAAQRNRYSDMIAFRVRKKEQMKRLRELTLEHGKEIPGRRRLEGIEYGVDVSCAAPHELALLVTEESPSSQTD